MSYQLDLPVQNVTRQGPELVFVVYPQIFANLPAPHLWAILFFVMLIFLGIDSQVGNSFVENLTRPHFLRDHLASLQDFWVRVCVSARVRFRVGFGSIVGFVKPHCHAPESKAQFF